MVKVSISLPNNTQITFESEESDLLHEIVTIALRDLPRDLMKPSSSNGEGVSTEKSNRKTDSALSASSLAKRSHTPKAPEPKSDSISAISTSERISNQAAANGSIPPEFLSSNGRVAFEAFCLKANPLGDMRRVVVAAEGATRHFGVDGVNSNDLGWLFDAAGWRRPGNFTQTLRNAARSKFGWMERIPGRSGRYAATPLGVSKTVPIV
jgi:hypothetical protein